MTTLAEGVEYGQFDYDGMPGCTIPVIQTELIKQLHIAKCFLGPINELNFQDKGKCKKPLIEKDS